MVVKIRQELRMNLQAPDRVGGLQGAPEERMDRRIESRGGGFRVLVPVAFVAPWMKWQRRAAAAVVPTNRNTPDVQRAERCQERGGFGFAPPERVGDQTRHAVRLEGFGDGARECRMRAEFQIRCEPRADQCVHAPGESHALADVSPPIFGIEIPGGRKLRRDGRADGNHRGVG